MRGKTPLPENISPASTIMKWSIYQLEYLKLLLHQRKIDAALNFICAVVNLRDSCRDKRRYPV